MADYIQKFCEDAVEAPGRRPGRAPRIVKAMGTLSLLLCLTSNIGVNGAILTESIDYKLEKCLSSSHWFDTAAFTCRKCPANQEADATGRACKCVDGFVKESRAKTGDEACKKCEPDANGIAQAPNQDATRCLPCSTATMTDCKCKNEKEIFVETTKQVNGAWTLEITCSTCPSGEFAGAGWECQKCPHFAMEQRKEGDRYKCACKAGYTAEGSGCVNDVDRAAFEQSTTTAGRDSLTFRSLQLADGELDTREPAPVVSAVFRHHLVEAGVGCWKDGVPRFCQVLANLCVLTLYDQQSAACRFLKEHMGEGNPGSANWANRLTDGLPWIQYTGTDDSTG